MSWLVVKTVPRREAEVAKALEAEGWVCWVPVRLATILKTRVIGAGVHVRVREIVERPLLPGYLVAKSVMSASSIYEAGIRHFEGVWTDGEMNVRRIPDCQIEAFCDTIESINARERKRLADRNKKKDKPKTIRLSDADPEDLKRELMTILFGQPLEAAA